VSKRSNALDRSDRCEILAWVYLLLAELPFASRRKLLELPTRDLREFAAQLRAAARTARRAA